MKNTIYNLTGIFFILSMISCGFLKSDPPAPSKVVIEGEYGFKLGSQLTEKEVFEFACQPDSSAQCKPTGYKGKFKGEFSVLLCQFKAVAPDEFVSSVSGCVIPSSKKIYKLNVATNIVQTKQDQSKVLVEALGKKYGSPTHTTQDGLIWDIYPSSIIVSHKLSPHYLISYTNYNLEDELIAEISKAAKPL